MGYDVLVMGSHPGEQAQGQPGPGPSKPRLGYFLLAAVVGLGGVAAFVFYLLAGISGLTEEMIRVVVPGVHEVLLDRPGEYTVFRESPSAVGNQVYDYEGPLPGLTCRLEGPAGDEVPVRPARGSMTYSLGGRHGVSVLEFTLRRPGRYTFRAAYPPGKSAPPVVFTLAEGASGKIVKVVLVGLAILLAAMGGAATLLALGFTRGRRDKDERPAGLPPPIG